MDQITDKEKIILKQNILNALPKNKSSFDIYTYAQNNEIERHNINVILVEMEKENKCISFIDASSDMGESYIVTITDSGIYFLEKGGFLALEKKQNKIKTWIIAKKTAVAFGAFITILTAVLTLYFTYESNKLENEQLKKQIKAQEKTIQILKLKKH
jgi:hypothetical protein